MLEVTVAVPTYGRAATLALLLADLTAQTQQPVRVLLVDDTPGDEIERVAAAWRDRLPLEHMRPGGRRSLTRARNLAIAACRTPVLAFIDSDVGVPPTHLEHVASILATTDAAAVQVHCPTAPSPVGWRGAILHLFLQGVRAGDAPRFQFPFRNHAPRVRPAGLVHADWLAGNNLALHLERLGRVRFDAELEGYALAEDVDFTLALRRAGARLLLSGGLEVVERKDPEGRLDADDLAIMRLANWRRIMERHGGTRWWHRAALAWQQLGQSLKTNLGRPLPGAFLTHIRRTRQLRRALGPDGRLRMDRVNALYRFYRDESPRS